MDLKSKKLIDARAKWEKGLQLLTEVDTEYNLKVVLKLDCDGAPLYYGYRYFTLGDGIIVSADFVSTDDVISIIKWLNTTRLWG